MKEPGINASDPPQPSLQELVDADRKRRTDATRAGISALLQENRTELAIRVTMSSAQPQPAFLIDIIAND